VARNLDGYQEPYRLFLSFEGLPSQSGLTGTRLNATTSWPYTAASSLLAAYEAELIGDYCPSWSDGKADQAAGAPIDEPAGCAVSSAPAGGGALVLVLAAALLALRRRAARR
jgi:MYXO-CTERM domain-containing protein